MLGGIKTEKLKKYLYYPNLEPANDNWLKFALLYMDKFESIVPYARRDLISDNYKNILDNTDVLNLFSPTYQQGERATILSIEEFERIQKRTFRHSSIFNKSNLIRDWRKQENWNYQIYSEKFSVHLRDFIVSENYGIENDNGLLMPQEMAFVFMSFLANEISFENDLDIITDNKKYSDFTYLRKIKVNSKSKVDDFKKATIKLVLPKNISDISFKNIITFRNNNRKKIKILNEHIDLIGESISNGLSEMEFIKSYKSIFNEFSKELLLLGIGSVTIPLGTYMLIKNPESLDIEYVKEALEGIALLFGGGYSLKKSYKDRHRNRQVKKYLTNLGKLE